MSVKHMLHIIVCIYSMYLQYVSTFLLCTDSVNVKTLKPIKHMKEKLPHNYRLTTNRKKKTIISVSIQNNRKRENSVKNKIGAFENLFTQYY